MCGRVKIGWEGKHNWIGNQVELKARSLKGEREEKGGIRME